MTLAILHGSQATGHASANSDWDVAVLAIQALRPEERSDLRRAFAQQFGVPEEKVDISDLRADSPLLRYRVAMHGRLIRGTLRDFREFQVVAWKDYLDTQKFRNLQAAFLDKAFL